MNQCTMNFITSNDIGGMQIDVSAIGSPVRFCGINIGYIYNVDDNFIYIKIWNHFTTLDLDVDGGCIAIDLYDKAGA